jgi:hypothetical protein
LAIGTSSVDTGGVLFVAGLDDFGGTGLENGPVTLSAFSSSSSIWS